MDQNLPENINAPENMPQPPSRILPIIIAIFVTVLIVGGGAYFYFNKFILNSESNTPYEPPSAVQPMEITTFSIEDYTISDKDTADLIDYSKPEAVVQAIFDAAKTRNSKNLPGLCDPEKKNDQRTKLICNLQEIDKVLFIFEFENGKVLGEAKIEGNIAKVPYGYGIKGADEQIMQLINRNGKWYLYRFFSD